MRAFIVRPFGVQKGIDFDAVERLLIDPALDHLNISGRTTVEILRQGNIRLDMFQRLLAEEVKGFEWEIEGLRIVGRAQIDLRAFDGARITWEAVRGLDVRDEEANTWLATIYQRLGDLVRSDQAVRRALERRDLVKEK